MHLVYMLPFALVVHVCESGRLLHFHLSVVISHLDAADSSLGYLGCIAGKNSATVDLLAV